MVALSDYRFERIYESPHFALKRGRIAGVPGSVLVRSPIGDHPDPMHIKWLEHEHGLRAQLESTWAILPLELIQFEGRPSLVMEDPAGEPLDIMLRGPMEMREFLPIAIQAATALSRMHRKGLIHKNIKPANIFLDKAGHVRLTDFGIASNLTRERQAPVPVEVIAGTFAYMAPEQTGRMNRSMDARSDLYSLGVTFYEMVTGRLPFSANDPLEWVHCHTAVVPTSPGARSGVTEPVSAIIMKLLAKTAEDRYQTAAGLAADLLHCQTQLTSHGKIGPFPLGANDVSDRLLISERLYGRDAEIALLLSAFDRVVATGTPELVLVSGYSGVGKSSVVNELHKVLVPPRGLFASGKFDQFKRDIPYATLAQAFQGLVRQILGKSDLELKRWRDGLQEALGPNGQIMVNLIPELEVIVGAQPPIPELSATEAAGRFQTVFRRFLGVFAKPEHPLALFLDDLQWLDIATLQLLRYLVTEPEVKHVLFVGAFRDNEVGSSHPLLQTIDDIRKVGRSVEDIVLSPLSVIDIGHLIDDAFHCPPGEAGTLTRLVYEKTGGNPFFAIQFLTELAEKNLIAFDAASASWRWNVGQIQAQGFTDNVVDLMTLRLNRLSQAAQRILRTLAYIGNTAELRILALALQPPEQNLGQALSEAVDAGLVSRDADIYRFLHDRIQEAAYGTIPEPERGAVHLRIGRLLSSSLDQDKREEMIFEIVNQFDRSIALIDTETERDNVAEMFFAAAQRAKSSTAYRSAIRYLTAGRELLGDAGWERQYHFTFAFELNMAECQFLVGDMGPAERRVEELLKFARTKVDSAAVYKLKTIMHQVKTENAQAVESALQCLRIFGLNLSPHPSRADFRLVFADVEKQLFNQSVEALIDLPLATDPEVIAQINMLAVSWAPAVFTDISLYGLVVFHWVDLTLKHGLTPASPEGLALCGMVLSVISVIDYQTGYEMGCVARDLVKKHGFKGQEADVLYQLAYMSHFSRSPSQTLEANQTAFLAGLEAGNLRVACYTSAQLPHIMFTRGDHVDDLLRESERSIKFLEKAGWRFAVDMVVIQQRFFVQLANQTYSFATLDGVGFDEASFEDLLTKLNSAVFDFWYWSTKCRARYMSCLFDEASYAFNRAKSFLSGFWLSHHIEVGNFWFFSALTLSALDPGGDCSPSASEHRTHILKAKDELSRFAKSCPDTFDVQVSLVTAEISRIDGRSLDAIQQYEEAIIVARAKGFVHYEGIAHEVAARFYLAKELETAGMAHLRYSRNCYERWGAVGKVRQLEELYPTLRQPRESQSSRDTTHSPAGHLDVLAAVKATQAISREIILDDLVRTLLTVAIEAAGAERGLLIMIREEYPWIVAEATAKGGQIEMTLRQTEVSGLKLPLSALQFVMRTKESLILDDATGHSEFSSDEYVRLRQIKSILLLPIVKQSRLAGILFLENNLTTYAFTSERLTLLQLLSSQAAISLENASLYTELRRSEAFLAEGQKHSSSATWSWNLETGDVQWSNQLFQLLGFRVGEVMPSFDLFANMVHPDDRASSMETWNSDVSEGRPFTFEFRLITASGETRHFWSIGRPMDPESSGRKEYMGTLIDITERKLAAQALINAQEDFRRVAQLTTMGELAASIAHEINQPLTSIITNANACLRWLADGKTEIVEARRSAQYIVDVGHRAANIVEGIYRLSKRQPPEMRPLDVNVVIRDVLIFMRGEFERQEVVLHTELSESPAMTSGDDVQLRQVIVNIVRNGIEAMTSVSGRQRLLKVTSKLGDSGEVDVVIQDAGPGLDASVAGRIFNPFVTTKADGMGLGLSICRNIIESHGGTLVLSMNGSEGAAFQISLPAARVGTISEIGS